jgi:ppGpp synthetase/RelA/SpoT-type nucleotidyltranferase
MNEAELLERWAAEKVLYAAWGQHVVSCVIKRVAALIVPRALDEVLKIPPVPRLKADSSFVDKAFHRGKNYPDAYEGVEDKVGVRFVVLLADDVKLMERAVRDCGFEVSKDRDFESEREAKPLEFTYQSDHFVVRNSQEIKVDGLRLPKGMSCEVQVRTLLQHAHSELTHDRIYKGKTEAPTSVRRTVARSMALIETTDEFFGQVVKALEDLDQPTRKLTQELLTIYNEKVIGAKPDSTKSNVLIVDALRRILGEDPGAQVRSMLQVKPYIADHIASKAASNHLFRQPAILLAYLGVLSKPAETIGAWPLTQDELRPIFTQLGKNIGDY